MLMCGFFLSLPACLSFLLLKHHLTLFTSMPILLSSLRWHYTMPLKRKCSGWILTPAAFPPRHANLVLLFSIWLPSPSFLSPPPPSPFNSRLDWAVLTSVNQLECCCTGNHTQRLWLDGAEEIRVAVTGICVYIILRLFCLRRGYS